MSPFRQRFTMLSHVDVVSCKNCTSNARAAVSSASQDAAVKAKKRHTGDALTNP